MGAKVNISLNSLSCRRFENNNHLGIIQLSRWSLTTSSGWHHDTSFQWNLLVISFPCAETNLFTLTVKWASDFANNLQDMFFYPKQPHFSSVKWRNDLPCQMPITLFPTRVYFYLFICTSWFELHNGYLDLGNPPSSWSMSGKCWHLTWWRQTEKEITE